MTSPTPSPDVEPTSEPEPSVPEEPPPEPFPILPEAERYAIRCAWKTVTGQKDNDPFYQCPMVATLFAAVAGVYEGAEDDPPICGVLQAIRDTLNGWAHATGETELFASVP